MFLPHLIYKSSAEYLLYSFLQIIELLDLRRTSSILDQVLKQGIFSLRNQEVKWKGGEKFLHLGEVIIITWLYLSEIQNVGVFNTWAKDLHTATLFGLIPVQILYQAVYKHLISPRNISSALTLSPIWLY